ncbi:hypothetical protein A4A49_42898 [Nicotiana attenuata]|uniref:Uncharacterized protein n=1 Tax=Nicotiana attenuata TaxID=49451 RepID=A0A1J6KC49_NICAT|nr:hypothetical protein A4A49_42898 [Nicotiana attenuata]
MLEAAFPDVLEACSLALLSVNSASSLELALSKKSSLLKSRSPSSSLPVSSKSFPLAVAATILALICSRNLLLLSTISCSSPPENKDTYFSFLGKNRTYSRR